MLPAYMDHWYFILPDSCKALRNSVVSIVILAMPESESVEHKNNFVSGLKDSP